jgi:hypothetical protein
VKVPPATIPGLPGPLGGLAAGALGKLPGPFGGLATNAAKALLPGVEKSVEQALGGAFQDQPSAVQDQPSDSGGSADTSISSDTSNETSALDIVADDGQ